MSQRRFESVYSTKVRAGKRRTYFFDVRRTKGEDFYITLTESTKRFNGDGYDRHKIFLYKEDFNRFLSSLTEAIDHVKSDLMPDYDYDEFTRRQEEWEQRRAEEDANPSDNGTADHSDYKTDASDDSDNESPDHDEDSALSHDDDSSQEEAQDHDDSEEEVQPADTASEEEDEEDMSW